MNSDGGQGVGAALVQLETHWLVSMAVDFAHRDNDVLVTASQTASAQNQVGHPAFIVYQKLLP